MSPLSLIVGAADGILSGIDELITSDEERLTAETKRRLAELQVLAQQMRPQIMELEIAQAQAQHPSWFVAGARPSFDWILNAGIAYGLILAPLANWAVGLAAWAFGAHSLPAFVSLPALDWDVIAAAGSLRVGTYGVRAFEKKKGVARENLTAPTPRPATAPPQRLWPGRAG